MSYSVGIGLTNDCNLDCDHCYRDTESIHYVSLSQINLSFLVSLSSSFDFFLVFLAIQTPL